MDSILPWKAVSTDRKAVCGFAGELEISLSSWRAVSTDRKAVCGIAGDLEISLSSWIAVSTDRKAKPPLDLDPQGKAPSGFVGRPQGKAPWISNLDLFYFVKVATGALMHYCIDKAAVNVLEPFPFSCYESWCFREFVNVDFVLLYIRGLCCCRGCSSCCAELMLCHYLLR